jgi:hypothetical protein
VQESRIQESKSFVDFDHQAALAKTRHHEDCGLMCEGQ